MASYAILVEAKVEFGSGSVLFMSSLVTEPDKLFTISTGRVCSITELIEWQKYVLDTAEIHSKRMTRNSYDNRHKIVWFSSREASTIQEQKSYNIDVRNIFNNSSASFSLLEIKYHLIKKPTLWTKLGSFILDQFAKVI